VSSDGASPRPHRVVIVGGGFGGVRVAQGLEHEDVQVTLIDRTNHHLFQPLLYQVATGVLSPGQIAPALRSLFRGQENVRVVLGSAEEINLERRFVKVVALEATRVPYDTLILATGSTHSYFGHEEWSVLAPGMKTLDDAGRLRSRILGAFELAEQERDPRERARWMTFAIVGAGPTGVELAGQITTLAQRVLRGEYRTIDPAQARIVVLDAGPKALNGFAPRLQARAERDLRDLGVEVDLSAPVVDVDPGGVTVKDQEGRSRRIDARTVIWAAGVRASALAAQVGRACGAPVDRAGRVGVGPDLSLPGHPEVFAIGDMIAIPGVPGVAQPAIQEGKYVASVIRARLAGGSAPRPFKYRNLGMMATIGRTRAVADLFGKARIGGFPAFVIWAFIHLVYLVGWGNRFGAVTRWLWTFLARNRRERLISLVSLATEEEGLEQVAAIGARASEPSRG
jgi:NADH:quinone reductase (non-electrogenic)